MDPIMSPSGFRAIVGDNDAMSLCHTYFCRPHPKALHPLEYFVKHQFSFLSDDECHLYQLEDTSCHWLFMLLSVFCLESTRDTPETLVRLWSALHGFDFATACVCQRWLDEPPRLSEKEKDVVRAAARIFCGASSLPSSHPIPSIQPTSHAVYFSDDNSPTFSSLSSNEQAPLQWHCDHPTSYTPHPPTYIPSATTSHQISWERFHEQSLSNTSYTLPSSLPLNDNGYTSGQPSGSLYAPFSTSPYNAMPFLPEVDLENHYRVPDMHYPSLFPSQEAVHLSDIPDTRQAWIARPVAPSTSGNFGQFAHSFDPIAYRNSQDIYASRMSSVNGQSSNGHFTHSVVQHASQPILSPPIDLHKNFGIQQSVRAPNSFDPHAVVGFQSPMNNPDLTNSGRSAFGPPLYDASGMQPQELSWGNTIARQNASMTLLPPISGLQPSAQTKRSRLADPVSTYNAMPYSSTGLHYRAAATNATTSTLQPDASSSNAVTSSKRRRLASSVPVEKKDAPVVRKRCARALKGLRQAAETIPAGYPVSIPCRWDTCTKSIKCIGARVNTVERAIAHHLTGPDHLIGSLESSTARPAPLKCQWKIDGNTECPQTVCRREISAHILRHEKNHLLTISSRFMEQLPVTDMATSMFTFHSPKA